VKYLILKGVDVNARTGYYKATPLHLAVDVNPELVKIFIKAGADVNARASDRMTPLHHASLYHGPAAVASVKVLLAANGIDVNAERVDGCTALHTAKNPEMIRLLLKAGANPNAINMHGETPLVYVSKDALGTEAEYTRIKALLVGGANPVLRDQRGRTASQYIRSKYTYTQSYDRRRFLKKILDLFE